MKEIINQQNNIIPHEQIGIFATLYGIVELTIGSLLHTLHIPFKGHLLTLVQIFLLTQFAKNLQGRYLILISTIAAGLKSFTPAGSKLKPMFYIFIQGVLFALPIKIIGLNILSILLGALLLGISTIYLSIGLNYLLYGQLYLKGVEQLITFTLQLLHLPSLNFWQAITYIALIKSLLIILLTIFAYYYDATKLLTHLVKKIPPAENNYTLPNRSSTWKESLYAGSKDLITKYFLISFIITLATIYYFAHPTTTEFIIVTIRALLLSWGSFIFMHKINFNLIIDLLKRYNLHHWAVVLENTLKRVHQNRHL